MIIHNECPKSTGSRHEWTIPMWWVDSILFQQCIFAGLFRSILYQVCAYYGHLARPFLPRCIARLAQVINFYSFMLGLEGFLSPTLWLEIPLFLCINCRTTDVTSST